MLRTLSLAAALALGAISLTGCNTFGGGDDDRNAVTDTTMYAGVPSGAIRAAQGYDTVRYRSSQPARVLIGNDVRRMIVTEFRVNAGDEITVDANGDRVLVNGVPVYQQNLEKRDQHSIFIVQ